MRQWRKVKKGVDFLFTVGNLWLMENFNSLLDKGNGYTEALDDKFLDNLMESVEKWEFDISKFPPLDFDIRKLLCQFFPLENHECRKEMLTEFLKNPSYGTAGNFETTNKTSIQIFVDMLTIKMGYVSDLTRQMVQKELDIGEVLTVRRIFKMAVKKTINFALEKEKVEVVA